MSAVRLFKYKFDYKKDSILELIVINEFKGVKIKKSSVL